MYWRDQLTLINNALKASNLITLNIITDTEGYLVKNDILRKNLDMFLPFVSQNDIDNIYYQFMIDSNNFNSNISNKQKIIKIINQLEFNLPVKI